MIHVALLKGQSRVLEVTAFKRRVDVHELAGQHVLAVLRTNTNVRAPAARNHTLTAGTYAGPVAVYVVGFSVLVRAVEVKVVQCRQCVHLQRERDNKNVRG